MLVLHERHHVHVALAPDDENALAVVTVGVRVLQDVEQIAAELAAYSKVARLGRRPLLRKSTCAGIRLLPPGGFEAAGNVQRLLEPL